MKSESFKNKEELYLINTYEEQKTEGEEKLKSKKKKGVKEEPCSYTMHVIIWSARRCLQVDDFPMSN